MASFWSVAFRHTTLQSLVAMESLSRHFPEAMWIESCLPILAAFLGQVPHCSALLSQMSVLLWTNRHAMNDAGCGVG